MSAGKFSRSKYEANDTSIHPIRVQPETIAMTHSSGNNEPPPGDINNKIPAKVSGGVREFALIARQITIVFESDPPDGYEVNSPIRLPILTLARFNAMAENQTVGYLGKTAKIVGTRGERPE